MNIRIDSVIVNNLGPIASLKYQFKDINLIYGKNEQGKTFLVEYLLRSLFKSAPQTRDLPDSGQVLVSGIGNQPIIFNPKSKEKLENFLFGSTKGIQIDLSRLCVVKAGELSLTSTNERINKSILKEYLSDQHILEAINNSIPITTRESIWENGEIIGKKQQGQIKELSEKQQTLKKIDDILHELDENFSLGEIKCAEQELTNIEQKLVQQERAKRNYAQELWNQISLITQQLATLSQNIMEEITQILAKVDSEIAVIQSKQANIKELTPKCENYQWLKSAIEECEKRPDVLKKDKKNLFLSFSIIGIVVAIIMAFFKIPILTLVFGGIAVFFLILSIIQSKNQIKENRDRNEVAEIYREFENKFGVKTRTVATLKSTYEITNRYFITLQNLESELQDVQNNLSGDKSKLFSDLESLYGASIGSKEPNTIFLEIKKRRSTLESTLQTLKEKLAATQVIPEEYLDEKMEFSFDPIELKKLEISKRELEDQIKNEKAHLDILKQRLCDITNDLISIRWEDLIEHLREKRNEVSEELKRIKAQIIAGILITQVISEFQEKEDENIDNSLRSNIMTEPIQAITHSYNGVELDGNELIVFNELQRFPISQMSTGAQEQILLALRLGLASHVLGDQKMFLLLDDAFQHSDWERREWLVDEMAEVTSKGWQILYFSMDDHILSLFENKIKPKFWDRYALFRLNHS